MIVCSCTLMLALPLQHLWPFIDYFQYLFLPIFYLTVQQLSNSKCYPVVLFTSLLICIYFNFYLIDNFFQSLRKVGQDPIVLLMCITVFLSYLPEAGQYSCMFIYLKQVRHSDSFDSWHALATTVFFCCILSNQLVLMVSPLFKHFFFYHFWFRLYILLLKMWQHLLQCQVFYQSYLR